MEGESNADLSILLQFAKFSKGFRIADFDEFVQDSIGVENFDFFGRLAYPNQWQMRLTNPELRERLIRTGRTRIKNRSCWVYPLNQQEIRGFVHWLPNSVTNDQLMEQLKVYGNVLFIESQERVVKERKVESDPRYYGLMLPHGTIKEDLPHFLKINGFLSLVVVRGREPACFHCKEVGHRRAECPKYQEKLISYCNREPNTAPTRLKPRGRRHVKVETEVKDETGGNEISSSDDVVRLEKEVPIDEETIELQSLPVLENLEQGIEVQEEVKSSTETKIKVTSALVEGRVKYHISTSAAAFSETETETQGIVETLQQIQRRTVEDLQRRFENFEKEIAQTLTRGKLSTHAKDQKQSTAIEAINTCINLEQERSNEELEKQITQLFCAPEETSTPTVVEMLGEDYNVDPGIKGAKEDEIRPAITLHQVKVGVTEALERIRKKSEEIVKGAESTVKVPTSSSDTMRSVLQILEETKQAAVKTFESTFKKLEEFAKTTEMPSKESDSDTKDEIQTEFAMLEQAKQTASKCFESTFKKLEEQIANLSSQPTDEQISIDANDIQFVYQMLEQAKKTVGETVQKTFGKLTGKFKKEIILDETSTKSSTESKPSPKIERASRKSDIPFEQRRLSVIDMVRSFSKEDSEVVEAENYEKQFSDDKREKEIIQTDSDPAAASQDIFKAATISESGEEATETEKVFIESEGLESDVPKVAQVDIDDLQTKIGKIFISVLTKGKLLSETSTILKQVELEVNEVVEETKKRQKN